MADRDGKQPTPVTNGHRPASDGATTPEVQRPAVLHAVVKPRGTPRVAGNRLPPPMRSRTARLVRTFAAQGPNTPLIADDEATLVDGTKVLSPPPPPETFEPLRRRREREHTQIVTPLPPPELERRGPADPLAQTAGEIVCGRDRASRRRMPRAAVVIEGARRRGLGLGLGLAVGIAAMAGAALGLSAISSSGMPRIMSVPAQVERAARVEEAPPAPRRPIVEELPVAAREPEAAPAEPLIERDDTPPRVERAPVARPLRQRTIAPSSSIRRHKTTQPARASKQARSRALSYDPDALFLKRP